MRGRSDIPLIRLLGGGVSLGVLSQPLEKGTQNDKLGVNRQYHPSELSYESIERITPGSGGVVPLLLSIMGARKSLCRASQNTGVGLPQEGTKGQSTSAFSIIFDQMKDSWKSTKGVDERRVSLAVVRTLSSVQRIAVSRTMSTEGSLHALHTFTRFLAGSFFITLMLEHASSGKASKEFREETSSYITSVMKDRDVAASFLSTPGNTRRLFEALSIPEENTESNAVLGERVWKSMKDIDDIPLELVSQGDLDIVVSNMGLYRQNEYTRRIALRMFRWWCQFGGPKKVSTRSVLVKAIDCMSTAANAVSGSDASSKLDIVRSMRYMIEYLSEDLIHHVLPWMWPLLCFAADGVGSQDWDLMNEALDAFTACLERGICPSPHLIHNSALPLLYSISREIPISRLDVAVRIAECIGALARSKSSMSQAQKRNWAELFSSWLIRLDPRRGDILTSGTTLIESKALSESVVDALASLSSSDAGMDGLQIAHLWLADLIIHISRMATPYSKVEMKKDKNDASWWKWIPFASQHGQSDLNVTEPSETLLEKEEAEAVSNLAEKMLRPATVSTETINPINEAGKQYSSWYDYITHPWWRKTHVESKDVSFEKKPVGASDPELALYINASQVGPVYARAVARRLLEISGNVFNVESELSQSIDENMSPLTAAAYSSAAEAVNKEVADNAVGQALKVLSALASESSDNRKWLLIAGLPRLLQIISSDRGETLDTDCSNSVPPDCRIPVKLQRQISRLLALLSMEISGSESIVRNNFLPWLQFLAASDDCKVSSNAAKALLHIEAANKSGLLFSNTGDDFLLDVPRQILKKKPSKIPSSQIEESLGQHVGMQLMRLGLDDKQDLFKKQKHKEMMWLDLSQERLTFHDGIHLLTPLAKHHEILAQEGIRSKAEGAPEFDVVFVHGIRGGAFITWRQEGAFSRGGARGNVDHSVCWPAAWLAPKFPQARMITVEYAAPATWWEGESLPLYATVNHLAERLSAAGIGSRPVVFICHSMGGIIVKEIIGQGTKRDASPALRKISKASVGAVFYSVPHAGSKLADLGWTLRYLGASPSRAVAHLKTDPHLHEMNSVIRDMCRRGTLQVLSFSEGLPTKLSYVSTHIVPHESAYPGYGEFQVLSDHDHITVCKPRDMADASFESLVQFLSKIEAKIHE